MGWKCANCGMTGGPNASGCIGFQLVSSCGFCATDKLTISIPSINKNIKLLKKKSKIKRLRSEWV